MRPSRTLMATILLDTCACSFSSMTTTPSIQTISRPFSNGCATLSRMRVLGAPSGGVTETNSPAPGAPAGEGSIAGDGVPEATFASAGGAVGVAAGGRGAGGFSMTMGAGDGTTWLAAGPRNTLGEIALGAGRMLGLATGAGWG